MKYADNTDFFFYPFTFSVRYILPLIHFPNIPWKPDKRTISIFTRDTPLSFGSKAGQKSIRQREKMKANVTRSRIDNPARVWHPALTGNGPRFWREMRGALFSLFELVAREWGRREIVSRIVSFVGGAYLRRFHFIFSQSHELEKSAECNGLVYK